MAACNVFLPDGPGAVTVTCSGTFATTDTTFNPEADSAVFFDREYKFPTPIGNVTASPLIGNVTGNATITGFGLEFVNDGTVAVSNIGNITQTVDPINTDAPRGALAIVSNGGNISLTGNGAVSTTINGNDAIDILLNNNASVTIGTLTPNYATNGGADINVSGGEVGAVNVFLSGGNLSAVGNGAGAGTSISVAKAGSIDLNITGNTFIAGGGTNFPITGISASSFGNIGVTSNADMGTAAAPVFTGMTLTALSNGNIAVEQSGGTINFASSFFAPVPPSTQGALVPGVGISATSQGNGTITVQVDQGATLSGTGPQSTGVVATATTGAVTVINSGNISAQFGVTGNSTTGPITIENSGNISASQVAIQTSGGPGNVTNSGSISGAVQLNGANSTFANFGTWNAIGNSSFAGPSTVNNNGNGIINISGPAGITLGAASTFNNSGTINAVSSPSGSPTITATTFKNSGLINLATGGTGTNQLTIVGNFVGVPPSPGVLGSTLNVSVGPGNSRADQLLIQGNATGTTSVNVFNIANQFIRNPIPVVTVTGNSSATFSLANPPPLNGLFTFSINQTSPGDFTLSSSLGPGGLGSIPVAQAARTATQVTIDGVETELRLRRDQIQRCAFVVSPECQSAASARGNRLSYNADDSAAGDREIALGYQDENKTDRGLYMAVKAPPPPQPVVEAGPKPAVWLQAFDDWQALSQSVAGQNDGTHQNTYGFQGGFDETWRNLFASGDALVLGLVGGDTKAIVHFDSGIAGANLSGPGFGGYWTYINGGFSMDGVVKNDWFHFTEDSLTTGMSSSARIQNFNATANAQYKFAVLTNSFIEPTAGVSYTQTTFSDVPSTLDLVNGHTTRVQGGARFGTAWDYSGIHFEPTLLGLAYSDVQITGTPLQTLGVPVPTDEGKVRGEFNLTLNADFGSGFSGFAEGDVRFGDNLVGGAIKGGLRKQW
jgi:hypothetical protein